MNKKNSKYQQLYIYFTGGKSDIKILDKILKMEGDIAVGILSNALDSDPDSLRYFLEKSNMEDFKYRLFLIFLSNKDYPNTNIDIYLNHCKENGVEFGIEVINSAIIRNKWKLIGKIFDLMEVDDQITILPQIISRGKLISKTKRLLRSLGKKELETLDEKIFIHCYRNPGSNAKEKLQELKSAILSEKIKKGVSKIKSKKKNNDKKMKI